MKSRNWLQIALVAIAITAIAAAAIRWMQPPDAQTAANRWRTELVTTGDITQSVSANGTLNPVVLVNVGTQVSGTVRRLHADFNQRVNAGDILVELDPALIQAAIRQNEANLAKVRSELGLAIAREDRTRELVSSGFVAKTQLEDAEATTQAARAALLSAKAQLEKEKTNLRYSVIRSPISGVVVARSVDLGTTVAASFQTPTLYQIAQDLSKMQIDTSVAEADVGAITVGTKATFTVDAFSETQFEGRVKQIRLNPTIQQNVVTYNVVISVDNTGGRLLPGMTAHARLITGEKKAVLKVPNAALRFRYVDENGESQARTPSGPKAFRVVNGKPTPVSVKLGLSDGQATEARDTELKVSDAVIVGETFDKAKRNGKPNPFSFRLF